MKQILKEAFEVGFNEGQCKRADAACILTFEEWYNDVINREGIEKLFDISVVSQQRELLLAFMQTREGHAVDTIDIKLIDSFLEGRSQ